MAAKFRKEYNPNKVARRKRRPIIYIICEGKETETLYFRHFRSRNCLVDVIPISSKHRAAEHLVKHAQALISQSDYYPEDGDQLWCVFDCDDNKNQELHQAVDYAEKQVLFEATRMNNTTEQMSIQRQIANTLRSKGFEVKTEIGLSDFKIDIAVIDPRDNSNYILGILLDGETYLNTQTTRDREIVQPSVLKNLNWNVARVWSVDWFKQPDVVTTRIIELINELISEQDIHTEIVSECTSNEQSSIKSFSVSSEEVLLNMPDTKATDYPDINYPYCDGIDSYIDMVVKNEQPIMYTLLCKRVASHLNISRVTSKSQYFVDMAMKKYHYIIDRDNKVICENINVFNEWDKYRPNVEASKRRPIEDIPSIELEIVLIEIVKQNLSIPEDGLTLTAAKRMGFARRGSNVDAALNEVLSKLIEQNKLCKSDGIITLSKQK